MHPQPGIYFLLGILSQEPGLLGEPQSGFWIPQLPLPSQVGPAWSSVLWGKEVAWLATRQPGGRLGWQVQGGGLGA